MNPLVGFGGSIARNCGGTQILSSWNCSAHWPGRVNVCVLYLHDGSAHCICYRNLLNMVVPENLPRGVSHPKFQKMYVSLQRRAQKCMKQTHGVCGRPRHTKIIVLPQFRTSDQHEVTKGLHRRRKNLRFITVLDVRRARSDERVARTHREFAFHHSFGRPTITFCLKGCFGDVKNLHFTTVSGVRRSLFALRVARRAQEFAFHHSFGRPTSTK